MCKKMNTNEITITAWRTPHHKIEKAFRDGEKHAVNHYFCEEPDPTWEKDIKNWSFNPYTKARPSAYYAWKAGFCEKWAELVRNKA